jgi:TadE-like protein
MMMRKLPLMRAPRWLKADDRGAYMIEFALIMPVFLLIVMGTFDLAFQAYARATLTGAVEYASRLNSLETARSNPAAVDAIVRDRVNDVARFATLSFARSHYASYGSANAPPQFNDDNGNGVRDPNECSEADGQGGAEDVVLYQVTMTYDRIFPLWRMMNQPQQQSIVARGLLRTQPYAIQNTAPQCPAPT